MVHVEETNLSKNVCTVARLLLTQSCFKRRMSAARPGRRMEVAETGSFLNPVISRCAEKGGILRCTNYFTVEETEKGVQRTGGSDWPGQWR